MQTWGTASYQSSTKSVWFWMRVVTSPIGIANSHGLATAGRPYGVWTASYYSGYWLPTTPPPPKRVLLAVPVAETAGLLVNPFRRQLCPSITSQKIVFFIKSFLHNRKRLNVTTNMEKRCTDVSFAFQKGVLVPFEWTKIWHSTTWVGNARSNDDSPTLGIWKVELPSPWVVLS